MENPCDNPHKLDYAGPEQNPLRPSILQGFIYLVGFLLTGGLALFFFVGAFGIFFFGKDERGIGIILVPSGLFFGWISVGGCKQMINSWKIPTKNP